MQWDRTGKNTWRCGDWLIIGGWFTGYDVFNMNWEEDFFYGHRWGLRRAQKLAERVESLLRGEKP